MWKMKVCLFCRHFYPHVGGNETQTMHLALELIKQGIEVMVVTGRIDKSYDKYEECKGIKIYRVTCNPFYLLIKRISGIVRRKTSISIIEKNSVNVEINSFRKKVVHLIYLLDEYVFMWNSLNLLKRHKSEYDLIHSQMLLNYGYMALCAGLKNQKPVLIKDASLGGLDHVTLKPNIQRKKEKLRKYAYFVAISSKIAENLSQQEVPEKNIFKIVNGINIENIDLKNNFNAIPNTLLYVGNFWQGKIKGLDVLIRALSILVQRYPDVKLLVAGKGNIDYYLQLALEYKCSSNVEFLGQVNDVDKLYRQCEIFVLPSRQEGMSNATLEAMSYGIPCVVTDVSGSSDQIENGKEGLIVPVEAYKEMAEALCYMLDNPDKAKEMGRAAKRKILTKFDISIVTTDIIGVYHKLVSEINNKK